MEFIKNSLVFQKCPKSTIQNTKFVILVWVFVDDDDDGDNEMIM